MTEALLDEHEARLLAIQLLPKHDVVLERGGGGRFIGSHRIMTKRKGSEEFLRCYAHGMSWVAAVIHLARIVLDHPPYVGISEERRTLADNVLKRFHTAPMDDVDVGRAPVPLGRARFLEPGDEWRL